MRFSKYALGKNTHYDQCVSDTKIFKNYWIEVTLILYHDGKSLLDTYGEKGQDLTKR